MQGGTEGMASQNSERVLVLNGVLFRNYLQKYGRIPQLDSKQENMVESILQQKSEDNIDDLISLFSLLSSNMEEESPRIVFRRMSGPGDLPFKQTTRVRIPVISPSIYGSIV